MTFFNITFFGTVATPIVLVPATSDVKLVFRECNFVNTRTDNNAGSRTLFDINDGDVRVYNSEVGATFVAAGIGQDDYVFLVSHGTATSTFIANGNVIDMTTDTTFPVGVSVGVGRSVPTASTFVKFSNNKSSIEHTGISGGADSFIRPYLLDSAIGPVVLLTDNEQVETTNILGTFTSIVSFTVSSRGFLTALGYKTVDTTRGTLTSYTDFATGIGGSNIRAYDYSRVNPGFPITVVGGGISVYTASSNSGGHFTTGGQSTGIRVSGLAPTITDTDKTVVLTITSTGITLPAAATLMGRVITIKNDSLSTLNTVGPFAGDNIDGGFSFALTLANDVGTFQSDGVLTWYVI